MIEKGKNQISFEYKVSPSYAVYSVSGGHGGLNTHGDILLNLFSERNAIPEKETFDLSENGELRQPPIETVKSDSVVRDVLFGISLHPANAKSLAAWLNDKADSYYKMQKRKRTPKDESVIS